MSETPSTSALPQTLEEIRENFGKAIEVFHRLCGGQISTLEQAERYFTGGMQFISGSYQGADVRLYPPKPAMVRITPEFALPKLSFNLGDLGAFQRLVAAFQEQDVQIAVVNAR